MLATETCKTSATQFYEKTVAYHRRKKLFAPVFKDLRVDGGLLLNENRLVNPTDMQQAILNSLHSGHPGRDGMIASMDEVWWPQIHPMNQGRK